MECASYEFANEKATFGGPGSRRSLADFGRRLQSVTLIIVECAMEEKKIFGGNTHSVELAA
jgi:hypothetical protein